MELNWAILSDDDEDDLVVRYADGRESYTGWTIKKSTAGYIVRWNFDSLREPFPTLDEAKRYCEVCYRVGVRHEV